MSDDEFTDLEEDAPEDIDKLIMEDETDADSEEIYGDGSFSY